MANIKDLKKRIKSTKGTFKITMAMKLVSAAKMSKAQEAILGSRPYAQELEKTVKAMTTLNETYSHPFLKINNLSHSYILLITSYKGLCGSYNFQLVKKVKEFVKQNPQEQFKVLTIGKKGKELISKFMEMGKNYQFSHNTPTYLDMQEIAKELGNLYVSGEVGNIYVAFNKFNSAISFDSLIKRVLPFVLPQEEKEALKASFPFDFKYDVSSYDILEKLIPETICISLYTAILDALASEHSARMTAMDNASKNCKEMIRTLTLKMNKLRQASITTELIEVVSGAQALSGQGE